MLRNIGVWELLIIGGVMVMLFGTKRLPSLGQDIAKAIKAFRDGLNESSQQNVKVEAHITNEDGSFKSDTK